MRAGAATTVTVGLVITSCIVAGLVHASRREDPPTSPVAGQEEAASSTSNDTRENELTDESLALSHKIFGGRLLEIAAEYRDYERVDQTIRWSPNLCRLPPRLPESMGAISASDSEETHGRKLYYLYARKPWQYKANVWSIGDDEAVDGRAPLG